MDRLLVFAIAIVIAGALNGGLYTATGQGTGGAIIVNRFTGNGWYCGALQCFPLKWNNQTSN
jgi:hypothetical protein